MTKLEVLRAAGQLALVAIILGIALTVLKSQLPPPPPPGGLDYLWWFVILGAL